MALRDDDDAAAPATRRQFELNVVELSEMSRYAVWLREMLGEGTRDAPLQDAPVTPRTCKDQTPGLRRGIAVDW